MKLKKFIEGKFFEKNAVVFHKNEEENLTKNKKSAIIKLHKTQRSDLQCADNLVI